MSAVANPVQITASDRLGFSLFIAAVMHAILIFGLGFGFSFARDSHSASMLEVVMVLSKTHQEPEDSKHIASENQIASGSTNQESQPSAPFSGSSFADTGGLSWLQSLPSSPTPPKIDSPQEPVVTQSQSPTRVVVEQEHKVVEQPAQTRDMLSRHASELAKLVAELRREEHDYAKRPRVNYINTLSAKTATEATYVHMWVEKVERIGNLNYPDEIRNRGLSGTLIISVLLNHDGNVVRTEVQLSSGRSLLDETAKRMVHLASPFQPFPAKMRENYDQLMITRTWLFGKDNTLLTQ